MKIYKIAGKTWRDKKDHVILYHASPKRLSRIGPMSSFRGHAGAFFSPSYKSIIRDWAPWVLRKKENIHPLISRWREIQDRTFELEDIARKTPEQEKELEDLYDKMEKTEDSFNKVLEEQKSYSKVFIHKVSCPREIFKAYDERMRKQRKEETGLKNLGFWAWGEQVFIGAEHLPKLKIIKVEEWDRPKTLQQEQDVWLQRYKSQPSWKK